MVQVSGVLITCGESAWRVSIRLNSQGDGLIARVGLYLYGLSTIAAGIFDLIWGDFEVAHQARKSFKCHGRPSWPLFSFLSRIRTEQDAATAAAVRKFASGAAREEARAREESLQTISHGSGSRSHHRCFGR